MKVLRNTWFALAFHLIPQIIVAFSYYSIFDILSVYLEEAQKELWIKFGIAWLLLFLTSLGLFFYHKIKEKKLGLLYATVIFLLYAIFLQFYGNFINNLFPFSIPRWVLDETTTPLLFYVLTLVGIVHAILIMVVVFTKDNLSKTKIWVNLLYSVLFPLFWFLATHMSINFGANPTLNNFIASILILSVAAFLFFIFRFIYGITQRKNYWQNNRTWVIILFGLIFPVSGLLLNNYGFNYTHENLFGDFSNPLFYIICVINSIVLLIPFGTLKNKWMQLTSFILKAIGFAYVLYFFFIFIPFLPLSILAIIAFGLGFLMLSPIFLFVIQLKCIAEDFNALKNSFSPLYLINLGIVGFLIIPLLVIGRMYVEKDVLHKAMDGINSYSLVDSQDFPNTIYLKNVLNNIEYSKRRNNFSNKGIQPIITPLYKTLVLDNLTLSQDKLEQIKNVYFPNDSTEYKSIFFNQASERVKPSNNSLSITSTKVNSIYKNGFYESSIDFSVKNNINLSNQEFATILDLPVDAFVTDYYLVINGEKVDGILAERKSAEWIYNEITNTNRDPGFLRYIAPNKVLLQIFPFNEKEVRNSGFKIIHKSAFTLDFCDKKLALGNETAPIDKCLKVGQQGYFLSPEFKNKLPNKILQPAFYYLMYKGVSKEYKEVIKNEIYINKQKYPNAEHFGVLVDFNSEIIDLDNGLIDFNGNIEGGFFAEKAIKKVLQKTKDSTKIYPVFVILEDKHKALFPTNDLNQYQDYLWEQDIINLEQLHAHNFKPISAKLFKNKELEVVIPNNGKASLIAAKNRQELNTNSLKSKDWESGMKMRIKAHQNLFRLSNINDNWLKSLKASFKTNLLNKHTAFIALENDAQRKLLLKKQEDILNGKYGLDAGEERRMSEPYFYILMVLLMLLLWFKLKP